MILLFTLPGLVMFCQTALAQSVLADASTLSVNVRMVEVYASVSDGHGKPVRGLNAEHFDIVEDGKPQRIALFEPQTAALTMALLIDTTGSMTRRLPHVKNAVARLLGDMKHEDTVGLFSFTNQLTMLHPFSRDRSAALRRLFEARAAGRTALYDSLVQLARAMSSMSGKKAILLFTDGDDNASLLPIDAVLTTTRQVGIPVYTIAQDPSPANSTLSRRLQDLSRNTGGIAFTVSTSNDVARAFGEITRDMQCLYLLGYYSEPNRDSRWHRISVSLPQRSGLKVRAKEGYRQ